MVPLTSLVCAIADVDTGLKDAMDVSADANGFLRTFPLQALLSRSVSSGCGVLLATHLQPLPAETKNQPGAERVLLDVFTLEFTCLCRVLDGSALGCGGRYIPVLLVEGFQLL